MKIRLVPVILSLIITLLVLFGGWWVYESVHIKQPIGALLDKAAHVTDYSIEVRPNHITVEVQVDAAFTLKGHYIDLLEQIKEATRHQNVTLTLKDEPDEVLLARWNELYFTLAEGIHTRNYRTMLDRLEEVAQEETVRLQVAMDREHLYVFLQESESGASLFQALPLEGSGNEVMARG